MRDKLSHRAVNAIRENGVLFTAVCEVLNIKTISLAQILNRQSRRLTEYAVIDAIRKHTGLSVEQIIETKVNSNKNTKSISTKKRASASTSNH